MNFLQLIYNTHHPDVFPTHSLSTERLPLTRITDYDLLKALKRLRPFKSFGVHDISGFIIKGCTDLPYLYLFLNIFLI
jgi:hypothetical protein